MKQKKILLLSYHSLPMDVISSYRTKAYLDHFPRNGYDVTLITHQWERVANQPWKFHHKLSKEIIEDLNENVRIIRLPRKKHVKGRWFDLFYRTPVISKIYVLLSWVLGYLDASTELYDSYHIFKSYLWNHLKQTKYDLSLSIFSPHFHHKLAYEIHKEFDIPYVLDFRDLWSNRIVHKNYKPSLVEKFQDISVKYFWKKWLGKAMFFSITSEEWKNEINSFTSTKGVVIYNGFDSEISEFSTTSNNLDGVFKIVHTGSLYNNQDLKLFFEAYKLFIEEISDKGKAHLYLIGAKKDAKKNLISRFNPVKVLESLLPADSYTLTPRIPRKESLEHLRNASLLWMPSFPDSPGTISGKFMEYLGAKKFIMVTSSGNKDIDSIIDSSKLGRCFDTVDEIKEFLLNNYQFGVNIHFNDVNIMKYSRENQVEKMVKNINKNF